VSPPAIRTERPHRAAQRLDVRLQLVEMRDPGDLENAFRALTVERPLRLPFGNEMCDAGRDLAGQPA
jgi:hypothetical protein